MTWFIRDRYMITLKSFVVILVKNFSIQIYINQIKLCPNTVSNEIGEVNSRTACALDAFPQGIKEFKISVGAGYGFIQLLPSNIEIDCRQRCPNRC